MEFKNEESIKEVMSSASFTSDCVAPVKSSVFWFRKEQASALHKNNQMVSLNVENGCVKHTDQQIAKLLCNVKSVSFFNILFTLQLELPETFNLCKTRNIRSTGVRADNNSLRDAETD